VGQRREVDYYRSRAAARSADEICTLDPEAFRQITEEHRRHGMIGRAFTMQRLFEEIARYAPYDKNVLVMGETGSGKGMVARALHHSSRRADRAFNEHNSSTIHENIAEGELFGFAADSGVANAPREGKRGVLVATDGGTLFLDEIGDMPLSIQTKMLKVVDRADGTFFPVGAEKPTRVDVRFVTATHKCLDDLVEGGSFRQDFLYRIRGVEIHVPPLRERKEDIPLLVADQIIRFSEEYDRPSVTVTRDAMWALADYAWPGNVRQLQDLVDCLLMGLGTGAREITLPAVLGVLHGQEAPSPSPPAAEEVRPPDEGAAVFERVLRGEENRTLSQIKRFHGEPIATETMRMTLLHLGRYPTEEQAGRLFGGMTANAWRQFAFSHGITLRKITREAAED
jgi:DNA-binding NtrC family response regulator